MTTPERWTNGNAIAARRAELGLTQQQLATTIGIAKPSLSQIERGYTEASARTLSRLCSALDLPHGPLLRTPEQAATAAQVIPVRRPRGKKAAA